MKIANLLASVVLLGSVACAEEVIPYVFKSGDDGYKCYRIPAIVYTKSGTLVALAEGRVNGHGDSGNIDLVAKTSKDGGKTWSKLIKVHDDGGKTCRNPVPITLANGNVILVSTVSDKHENNIMKGDGKCQVVVQSGGKDGKSWTRPTDISKQVVPDDFRWYATGPCSGIQIQEGKNKGRIVVPANHSIANAEGKVIYKSHSFYSDDGKTWKMSPSAGDGSNESSIAEVAPDLLVQNMRMQSHGQGKRAIRTSTDGGATWSDLEHDYNLTCPRCQASVVRDYSAPNKLYFANPCAGKRADMLLRQSTDGGKTWPKQVMVWVGPTGYSNVVVMSKGMVGVLYEAGQKDLSEGIAFKAYKQEDFKDRE